MRVWIDLTNSPHVLALRPVIEILRGLGAVDERLLQEGRLRRVERVDDLVIERRDGGGGAERVRRDPRVYAELLVSPVKTAGGIAPRGENSL
jgi:hypothetical protein